MAQKDSEGSPIVAVTIQSAIMSATSNLLAQALTAYRNSSSLVIDWVPVVQFVIWGLVNTPPNFMWQEYLESTFPAYHASPTKGAVEKAARSDDKALDRAAKDDALVEPKLNVRNTLTKTVLDQTIGAAVNTFLVLVYMHAIKTAMARPEAYASPAQSISFLTSGKAVDFSRVDWSTVLASVRADFTSMIVAGWKVWPLISLINFAFIKTVAMRNLVGGLAGIGWGIYVSLFAAS